MEGLPIFEKRDTGRIFVSRPRCGHLYTSKLEGMFMDMKQSEELVKQYKVAITNQPIDLKVTARPRAPCSQ